MSKLIIDSNLSEAEAKKQNPISPCPTGILAQQTVLTVQYLAFDGNIHQGQVVVHKDLAADIAKLFQLMLDIQFPLSKVVPAAHPDFDFDDNRLMAANVTSAFNYRLIAGSDQLSFHARGHAIDINPLLNPYIKANIVLPASATYNPARPGTLSTNHTIVEFMTKKLGWTWGGDWISLKDYQHFENPL
jgi:peptidoglycan LD-endopeptidase CwlK